MAKSKAKDETAEIAASADTMAAGDGMMDDNDDWADDGLSWRERRERVAKARIADPLGERRKSAEALVERGRKDVSTALAELRLARLELKAAEVLLASLPDAPALTPAPSLKAAAKATGRKHVE